ncbi:hypothetical protein [Helicobacter fennelliae]
MQMRLFILSLLKQRIQKVNRHCEQGLSLRGNLESTDSIVFLFLIILCMESLAFASE